MADENDKPEKPASETPGVGVPAGETGTPPPSAIPSAGVVADADAEKAAMVEQAKSRVAAVKESLAEQSAAAGTPKPPVKKKEEGPKPTDAGGHPLVRKLKSQFAEAIGEAVEFIGQLSINVDRARIVEICDFLKSKPETNFDYLSDLTCVHYPERRDAPFEIIYNLFSIPNNARVRLKLRTSDTLGVDSVTSIWPAANWLEREVFDLFGVRFNNHPD